MGSEQPALTWRGYQHTSSPVDTSLLRQSHHVTQNDSPQAAGHSEDRMPIWCQCLHILCCLTCCLSQTMFPDVICDANRLQASMLLDVPVKAGKHLIQRHTLSPSTVQSKLTFCSSLSLKKGLLLMPPEMFDVQGRIEMTYIGFESRGII